MGGFFGGGSQSSQRGSTVTNQNISPAQEELIRQLTPVEVGEAQLQFGTEQQAVPMLQQAVAGAQNPLLGALQTGQAERALPGQIGAAGGPLAGILGAGGADLLSSTPRSIISPLEQSFSETVLPGISSAAIRAGAPGGSAEQDLTTRATREFGRAATSELQRGAAARYGAAIPGLSQAFQFALAGPQAQAGLEGQERGLAVQRAQTPISLAQILMGGANNPIFNVPFAPPSTTQFTRGGGTSGPTAGAEAGSAVGSLLPLLMFALLT